MVRWKDARRSENVEDRRLSGGGGGKGLAMGGGIGGIIMALIAVFVFKQDPSLLLGSLTGGGGGGQAAPTRELTADEVERGEFVKTVLAYTEDVWDEAYPEIAKKYPNAPQRYKHPILVMFPGQVQSACGHADASMGPFYCPGDDKVYIDLEFFDQLSKRFKAPGDFAQAYVIAHEVGHHIQNLLGISDRVHREKSRISDRDYKRLSVQLELQADYFAGVWASRAQSKMQILEHGDIEEGLRAANAIGDDTLQRGAGRSVVPDSFTHGSSEQRVRWFKRGFQSGDPTAWDPFQVPYDQL